MLIVFPCSKADTHLLTTLSKVLLYLGPNKGFSAVVCPTTDSLPDGKQFADAIATCFDKVDLEPVDLAGITGWPLAPNRHMRMCAAMIAAKYPQCAGWYFLEADNTPLVPQWAAKFSMEYQENGKPFMGTVVPTRGFSMQNGQRVPQDGDPHMVGTGVYPSMFGVKSIKLPNADKWAPWTKMPLEPWDVFVRDEVVPFAHKTTLIQHNWQTKNYRVENEQIVCDDMDNITPELSHKKPWDGKAIVLHGCKDGSLAEIVLAGKIPKFRAALEAGYAPVKAPDNASPIPETVVEKPKGHPSFLASRIHKELNGGKMTAKGVAEKLKITIPEVLAVIAEPSSGLKVAGPVKWVSIA